ncbi:MAG: hypothetical protein A3C22_01500 [Candidatus Levybacteria bacterium RIFCSPHIGHO2_02_FULL_37_10]|nr:MAG: hypothetical protein A3C22_01500 [Candidatus Levybacteria bacterium RIFCSPHIGHO2_02_FULL_37_10]
MEKKADVLEDNKPTGKPLALNINNSISSIFTKNLFIFLLTAIVLGGITGYVFSAKKGEIAGNTLTSGYIDSSKVSRGAIVGSDDTKLFKDTAAGSLKGGGINGEGQFHLVRPGGESQNVYLTSSTLDLSQFIGKKIKVWGQTQAAQYAGWLMDVGRIEIL